MIRQLGYGKRVFYYIEFFFYSNSTRSNTSTQNITNKIDSKNLNSTITNHQCNYLLTQFETFAKNFISSSSSTPSSFGSTNPMTSLSSFLASKPPPPTSSTSSSSSSSAYSTLKSNNSSTTLNSSSTRCGTTKGVTLHKYSSFNHDKYDKNVHSQSLSVSKNNEEKEDLLCKYTSENTLKKTSFKQKSLPLKSIDFASHLLYNDTHAKTDTNCVVENYMNFLNEQHKQENKSTSTTNNVTNESSEEITLNMLDKTTTSDTHDELMPKFLHIDQDDDDDEEDECDNIDDIEDDSGSGKRMEINQNENKNKSKI
jgi:hypothetical protein